MRSVSFGQVPTTLPLPNAAQPAQFGKQPSPKFGFEPVTCCAIGCAAPVVLIGGLFAVLFIFKGLFKKAAGSIRSSTQ